MHDGDVAGQQVRQLREEQRRPQAVGEHLVQLHRGLGGRQRRQRGQRPPRRARCRARRRRRRRSGACRTTSAARAGLVDARARRHRCRGAARAPSAAGRPSSGSARRVQRRQRDAPGRARRPPRPPPARRRAATSAARCASAPLAQRGDQADAGDHHIAGAGHARPSSLRRAPRIGCGEFGGGEVHDAQRQLGIADALAVRLDPRLRHRIARPVMDALRVHREPACRGRRSRGTSPPSRPDQEGHALEVHSASAAASREACAMVSTSSTPGISG